MDSSPETFGGAAPGPVMREGNRSDTVYRSLLGWIEEGRIPYEGKLPTENELSQHFHVSRPVVRAAIAKLRDKGLVRSVQGSGTVVIREVEGSVAARSEVLQGSSVRDLQRCFEFRLLIESEAAYLAALRHGPASLKRISECVYPPTHNFPTFMQEPLEAYDFHLSVVAAADNPFLEKSIQLVRSQPGFQVYLRLCNATKAPDPVEHRTRINGEHREILRLIERRQADDAREYMRYHIQNAYDYMIDRIPVTEDM
ncbi:MAG: FadR family transcriptional regulator [Rhizobiaceae bacterium]|nr:FadR family transcriptional regulator [Rhizobiaceae bacterium]